MSSNRTTRDAGLRQVKTITKWIAGTAAALAGVIAIWSTQTTSHAGASTRKVTGQPSASSSSDSGTSNGGYSDPGNSSGTLQPPVAVPAPTNQAPSARSGGS